MQITRGIIYPMVVLLIILFAFEIISPSFKSRTSASLDLSQSTRKYDVVSNPRSYGTSGKPGNEEAQELLLESLTLLRELMIDIKSGSK